MAAELSPLIEIEYRAAWLEQNPRASRAVVLEELAGIRAAVDRERAVDVDLAVGLRDLRDSVRDLRCEVRQEMPPTFSLIRGGRDDG